LSLSRDNAGEAQKRVSLTLFTGAIAASTSTRAMLYASLGLVGQAGPPAPAVAGRDPIGPHAEGKAADREDQKGCEI
jgi:hypothetical protein